MVPDEKFNEKIADKEKEILNEKIKALSEAEKDQVYTQVRARFVTCFLLVIC